MSWFKAGWFTEIPWLAAPALTQSTMACVCGAMLEAEHWRVVEAQPVFVVHVWPPPPETHWPEELQLSAGPGGGGGGGGGGGVVASVQSIVAQPAVNLPDAKVLIIVLIMR